VLLDPYFLRFNCVSILFQCPPLPSPPSLLSGHLPREKGFRPDRAPSEKAAISFWRKERICCYAKIETDATGNTALSLRLLLDIRGVLSAISHRHAAPDSADAPLGTSTILPITPPFPSSSWACLASAKGNRFATSGLIFCC
jgi:hypothetical protein